MFDWLDNAIRSVSSKTFFVVSKPISTTTPGMAARIYGTLPNSYMSFVARFGEVKLFRSGSIYMIEVLAPPLQAIDIEGGSYLEFGRTDQGGVFFELAGSTVPDQVFQWRPEIGMRSTLKDFATWLRAECDAAQKLFSAKQWKLIREGYPPFTEQEKRIVSARRLYRWEVTGIQSDNDVEFEVVNGSTLSLPFLSVGVRGRYGRVNGAVWLPVADIGPGTVGHVRKACYKSIIAPQDIEFFDLPEPTPEDRDRYWEFKSMGSR